MTKDEAQHVRLLAAHLTAAFFAGSARQPDLTTDDVMKKYREIADEILRDRQEILDQVVYKQIP